MPIVIKTMYKDSLLEPYVFSTGPRNLLRAIKKFYDIKNTPEGADSWLEIDNVAIDEFELTHVATEYEDGKSCRKKATELLKLVENSY